MMERRKALTIQFSVERDNLMENPLKIPLTCLSSECGKLEKQVSWTKMADYKLRQSDSQHKNGSTLFDHNHVAKILLEMARRKPTVVLTDVLKTEMGKIYIERIKKCNTLRNRGQVTSTRRESNRCREEPQTCRETRSSQREPANDKNKNVTPKRNRWTIPSTFQSSRLRKRLHCVDNKEENKDIKEMIIGNDNGADHKFPEVVDCGLSVSWKPAKDSSDCDEFSPASTKDRCTDLEEVQHNLRKRKDSGSQLNGTGSPKRHCESLLCLTGEDERDGGSPSHICLEKSGEDGDLENLDHSIVQFTVGLDDTTEVVVPAVGQNLESEDFNSNPRLSLLSAQDISNTNPTDPIVLSSDDEETHDVPDDHSPAVHTMVTLDNPVIDGLSLQENVTKESEASDMEQVLHVLVDDLPDSVIISPLSTPSVDYTCMGIAFSTLYCGSYQGKANGDIMMADQKITIPLKDTSEQKQVNLTLQRKDLRRYSVWDQEEMEAQELCFKGDLEPCPAAVLLLCVSETALAAIQQDLCKLCNEPKEKQEIINTGKASPFILLKLKDPLEGMEGALLRSLLDIDCLNSLTEEQSIITHDADKVTSLDDLHTPALSLDVSIEQIRQIGLDSPLLSLLGLQTSDSGFYADQDFPHFDRDKTISPCIQLEAEPHTDTVLGLVTESEKEERTQQNPEDQEEEELEQPLETKEPTPLYTLCHQRTKGSYSVSLCKPSSNWTQYNHRGLSQRLIQFPPPPAKGGITVTVEDLQCLDSGQFLNDVIIDFYLKYLLENASAAVAERTHIFSSFFYKQLTRRDNASEGTTSDSCQRQRRHQRVRTWTRHVDIFNKDFLFVPVNQEAHWYLVVICFPGMDEAKTEAWNGPDSPGGTDELQDDNEARGSKSPNFDTEVPSPFNHSDNLDTETESSQEKANKDPPPGPVNCTEWTCQKNITCKRPCILIMDSLKLSLHERVVKLLREYLQSEWEYRRASSRDFGPDQMKSSHCQVPLQDNSSDCGLYLLQYVESFLKDPVVHFDLPLNLKQWFPRQKVQRKRDEIRDLVLHLYRHQNLEDNEQRCSAAQCDKIL